MKRQFICAVETNGEKKFYNRIGEVLTFDGNNGVYQKIKLYHIPGTMFSVFEDKPKNNDNQEHGFGA